MRRFALLLMSVLLLGGCQARPLVRVALTGEAEVPPTIDKLIDLGGVLSTLDDGLNRSESDGSFIAGEWVALTGQGLNGSDTRLFLDDDEIPIAGGLKFGGLLFQVPRTVRFRHSYALRVQTPHGGAATTLPVTNLLVMADTRADQLLVWRTSIDQEKLFDETFAVFPCRRAGPQALSPDGGFLYVVASAGRSGGRERFALKTLHLAAKDGPKEIASLAFETDGLPLSFVVAAAQARGYLLAGGELLQFDLADSARPQLSGRFALPATVGPGYGEMALFAGGARGAVTDEGREQILLLDLTPAPVPVLLGSFNVNQSAATGFRPIGIAADATDANTLWILAGLNADQVRLHLAALWSDKDPDLPPTSAALIRMQLQDDMLLPREPRAFPAGVLPFGLLVEESGDVLTSAVAYEKEQLSQVDLSLRGASSLVKGLWRSIFAGRIYRVKPDGTVNLESKSVNLPLSLARIADSPLVYSAYRLNIRYVPPSANVVLAVDVQKRQSLPVRAMEWTAILPPYRFFPTITLL